MTLRRLAAVLGALLAAWVAYGLYARSRRAPRPPPVAGELRGAWHVHTTRSDGRGEARRGGGARPARPGSSSW